MRERVWFMVLVLGVVGGAAGLGLAAVKRATDPIIERRVLEQKVKPGLDRFFAALGHDNDPIADRVTLDLGRDPRGRARRLAVFPARKAGRVVAVALRTAAGGYGGDLEVLTALDAVGARVLGAKALALKETMGLGARVADDQEPFVRQFAGLGYAEGVHLVADGGTVEAITGATISSKAFTAAVHDATRLFEKNRAALEGAAGRGN